MEFRHLLVRDADRIRRIILNRPERLNALNVSIGVELLQALEEVGCLLVNGFVNATSIVRSIPPRCYQNDCEEVRSLLPAF